MEGKDLIIGIALGNLEKLFDSAKLIGIIDPN
jgi:hypothetical protein